MESSGNMKVMPAPTVITAIIYKTSGNVSSTLQLRIRHAVNNPTESGGVIPPTAKLAIMATPKWIGSMPMDTTIGKRIGVTKMMIQMVSMKQPNTHNKQKNTSRIM